MLGGGDVELFKEFGRFGFLAVIVVFIHNVFEFGIAVRIEVEVSSFQQSFFFFVCLVKFGDSHDDYVEDRDLLVGKVVLFEPVDVCAVVYIDLVLGGFFLFCDDAQDGRFARAIRVDNAVVVVGVEIYRSVAEQGLGAVPFGELADAEHGDEDLLAGVSGRCVF